MEPVIATRSNRDGDAIREASFGISRTVTLANGDVSPHQPSNRSSSHPVPLV